MTIHVPKWLLLTVVTIVVVGGIGGGAYLLGRSSGDDTSAERSAQQSETEVPPPECTKSAARTAVLGGEFESSVRELGAVRPNADLFKVFVIGKLVCQDLTADGTEEMIVQLACCTASAPSPWAIFSAENGEWHLAFYRERVAAELSVQGDEIVEKHPAYRAGEPLCCPSTYRFGRVRWTGQEFVFESDEAAPNRTIKADTQGVTRVGDFDPQSGSPLETAEIFGPPAYVTPDDPQCINDWRDLGLLVNFANFGGADPCTDEGAVGSIELAGKLAEQAGWETDKGVHVGMTADELREIYPDARQGSFPGLAT